MNFGLPLLGLVDIPSTSLVARTSKTEVYDPGFALFRPKTAEVVTNSGKDIVILDAHNFAALRRIHEGSDENGVARSPISAALSPDGNRLFVVYFERPNQGHGASTPPLGITSFETYDLIRSTLVNRCVLQSNEDESPYFQISIAPDEGSFLFRPAPRLSTDNRLFEYSSQTCSILRTWDFGAPATRAEFSPDGKYMSVVFGGLWSRIKTAVVLRAENKELWRIPSNSENDMDWPVSISPDSHLLAISTDRHAESWSDAFREMCHIEDPGIEIHDLQTGRVVARVQFAKRTPSTYAFRPGTRLVRFVSSDQIVALAPDLTVRLYELSSPELGP